MIYVASAWRTEAHPRVIELLTEAELEHYDYRTANSFNWTDIDECYESWTPEEYIKNLDHPLAQIAFNTDYEALISSEILVLILDSGRSAHLEAGFTIGAAFASGIFTQIIAETLAESGTRDGNCHTIIYLPEPELRPELMYKMADCIVTTEEALINQLKEWVNEYD